MGIYAWLKLLNSTLAAEVPIIASMLFQNASGSRETLPLTILRAPLGPTQVSPRRSRGKRWKKSDSSLPKARHSAAEAERGTCLNKRSMTALPPFTPFLCDSKILGFALFALDSRLILFCCYVSRPAGARLILAFDLG